MRPARCEMKYRDCKYLAALLVCAYISTVHPVVIFVALALKENDSWAGGVHHRVLLVKCIKAALKVAYNVYIYIFSIIVKHSYPSANK